MVRPRHCYRAAVLRVGVTLLLLVGCGLSGEGHLYCLQNPQTVHPAAEAIEALPPKPWTGPIYGIYVPIDLGWWRAEYPDRYSRACSAAFEDRDQP